MLSLHGTDGREDGGEVRGVGLKQGTTSKSCLLVDIGDRGNHAGDAGSSNARGSNDAQKFIVLSRVQVEALAGITNADLVLLTRSPALAKSGAVLETIAVEFTVPTIGDIAHTKASEVAPSGIVGAVVGRVVSA